MTPNTGSVPGYWFGNRALFLTQILTQNRKFRYGRGSTKGKLPFEYPYRKAPNGRKSTAKTPRPTGWQSVNAESIEQLMSMQVVQTREALMNVHLAGTVPVLISGGASIILLLCFYKLRTKDVAIMARYNAGEITREECDAQLSRKY